ncbi:MAG TPA: carboxypeptidase regulatory-like domain-containing protein [Vicinamibacterales bacterium]|nr:carboxypeptidase regulatory-like domain-containing protein [Vicinamibacterales bacterium]
MRTWLTTTITILLALIVSVPALGQGGGASSTGTIQGRVTDAQGAVLPGVTVTATSPSALGAQTAVTSETGNYRFPALPPGVYELSFELGGFNTLKREGIQLSLGFTANVNVELALATIQETVTVSGASPIIDTSTTRIQQNFKAEQLQGIPNGRDMWALLAVTPSVQMGRIDVGGNRAGTQTAYVAYGQQGQVRVLIEGINTTEGTGGAGFYFDYASLDEAFLGTSGQGAEMPNPGVQSQFIARSGGNQFQAEYHIDWYNNAMQGSNIPDSYTAPTAFNNSPIRPHSNEIQRYYDWDINIGGPVARDKLWYFGTYRQQFNAVSQPNFQFDSTFNTKLWNPVVKTTYQINQKNKLIGYFQWGQKEQPNRLPNADYTYLSPEQTLKQDSGSWVYKAEWNSTLNDTLYIEARFGDFGYYFPLLTNSPDNFYWRDTGRLISEGAHQRQQLDRDRKQYNLAATKFVDGFGGNHTFKMGVELLKEQSWDGFFQRRGGDLEHIYNNGVSTQVIFGFPTSSCDTGTLAAHDCLTARANLDQIGAFLNDTWSRGRMTVNAGVRYDRYTGWLPEQQQLAGSLAVWAPQFPELANRVQAKTFAENQLYTWNLFAPRIGVVFDLTGDGRTVIKGNYGLYWHNPGVGVGATGNANIASKNATYAWNDRNGDKRWQRGEEGALQTASLEGAISVDPNIKAPYTHEVSAWVERQLTDTMGVRGGFVYKTEDDLFEQYQPGRGVAPFADAFTVPFTFVDIGVDGIRGTGDDRSLTYLGMPQALASQFPVDTVVMNTPQYGRFKTFELATTKRFNNRWSMQAGGSYTMLKNFPTGNYPQNPNLPGVEDRTTWNFKATGSYDAGWGIRLSPVVRHQSGVNFARTLTVSVPTGSGLIASGLAYAEPANANREDNIWVFDVRAEKTLHLGDRVRARIALDAFNLANSHASETIGRATGTAFRKPTAILAPFTTRIGFRLIF